MTQKSGKLKGKKAEPLPEELEFIYSLVGRGFTDTEILEEMQSEEVFLLRTAGFIKRRRREYNAAKKVLKEKPPIGVQAAEGLPAGKYLIDHYQKLHNQKLHKVLERFYDQLRTPELSELSLFTLKCKVTISHSYVSEMDTPAIIYDKGAVKLGVEASDPFLWWCLNKHLTVEFPEFSEDLGDWKKGTASIVEKCHDITKTIADQLTKKSWDSAEPDLAPASEDYGPGVFYHRLTELMYKCLMAHHIPAFPPRVSDSHGLLILVMDYSAGRQGIARGEDDLLNQVQQHCVGIASDNAVNKKVRRVLNIVEQIDGKDGKQELIKKKIRVVLERGIFKGTCSICSDLATNQTRLGRPEPAFVLEDPGLQPNGLP